MAAYEGAPSDLVRRSLDSGGFGALADLPRSVDAIVAAMDAAAPPLRLALGSNAHGSITKALTARLAAVEAQRETALSADAAR